jgi:hypothetical protein
MNDTERRAFREAIAAMASFERTFGRSLSAGYAAELYAADLLNLEIADQANQPGYDAVDADGARYQIKLRQAQNIDANNFNFDYIVLVNLGDDYELTGMWRMTVERAREIFTWRGEKRRKYQATQERFKREAERIG